MMRLMMATALMVAALAAPAWTQAPAPAEHDSHHPADSAKSEPAPATPAPAEGQPGMNAPPGGMPMMGMMSNMPITNMMNMMDAMHAAKMMGPGLGGMAAIDRVEGRIAFLRTELKITDAQAGTWNSFADALRANAKKLGELRSSMMGNSGDAQQPAATIADRLDRQEQRLLARLEGTRAMKAAFTKLNEALSDEQKKTANDILTPHMGMGMMAIVGAQMQPGQRQPGQMGSGKMQPGPGQMQQHGPAIK